MGRSIHQFTALAVARLSKRPGAHCDGGGLYLCVSSPAASSWLYRYNAPAPFIGRDYKAKPRGTPREMGLGSFPAVGLSEARQKAAVARKLKASGRDPLEERAAARGDARLADARTMTFAQAAGKYIDAHSREWSAKHASQWNTTLSSYALPTFGDLPVAAVDVALVLKALEPIWTVKPETASRVRGRIEAVLDWARARGHREGENSARWRGHLEHLLPARGKLQDVKHLAALDYREAGSFMAAIKPQDGIGAFALQFTVLTATRTGEITGATWEEIDFSASVWSIPAARMKKRKESAGPHRVPLSAPALAILKKQFEATAGRGFVFPGGRAGRPISKMAMALVLHRMGYGDFTVHGFRSTFRDWAAERTNFPRDVCEQALAHMLPGKVEAAYRRGDLLEKRRRLMEAWGAYCTTAPAAQAAVVPIRKSAS